MTTIPLSTFGYNAAFDEAQAAAEAAEASAVGVEGGALAAGAAVAGPVIVLLAVAAAGVVIGLKINDDNKKREAYTQQFVNDASKKYPHLQCRHLPS
jgi:hypothetical protein